jgi:hypothetical protein
MNIDEMYDDRLEFLKNVTGVINTRLKAIPARIDEDGLRATFPGESADLPGHFGGVSVQPGMMTKYNSVLILIAAAAVSANSSPAREDILTRDESRPPRQLQLERLHDDATTGGMEKICNTVFPIPEVLHESNPALEKQSGDKIEDAVAAALDDLQKPGRARVNAPGGPVVRVHAQAGILVFRGTWEETELVRSTLQAVKDAAQERETRARERARNLDQDERAPRPPQ